MPDIIDSKQFGLPASTVIEKITNDHYAILISRKSRIIMADGRKIIEKADKIKKLFPKAKISLKTTTAICSKTKIYLRDNNINITD